MTEPMEVKRTVYINRLPLAVTIAIACIAFSALIASAGLLEAQRHSQDEVVALRRQLSDVQAENQCRASFANQVNLALADKVIAIGDGQGLLEDFLIAIIKQDRAAFPAIQTQLARHRAALTHAGVELRNAVDEQRKALANC